MPNGVSKLPNEIKDQDRQPTETAVPHLNETKEKYVKDMHWTNQWRSARAMQGNPLLMENSLGHNPVNIENSL